MSLVILESLEWEFEAAIVPHVVIQILKCILLLPANAVLFKHAVPQHNAVTFPCFSCCCPSNEHALLSFIASAQQLRNTTYNPEGVHPAFGFILMTRCPRCTSRQYPGDLSLNRLVVYGASA